MRSLDVCQMFGQSFSCKFQSRRLRKCAESNIGHIKEQRVLRAPHREWRTDEVHRQEQSYLAGKVPPEVRNLIYAFLWEGSGPVSTDEGEETAFDQPGVETSRGFLNEGKYEVHGFQENPNFNPLSLLQTCRKIHLEAALFAFANHTFTLSNPRTEFTYLALARLTSLLSQPHISSISRLAYEVSSIHPYEFHRCALFIAHSLLLFPSVEYLEIRVPRNGPINHRLVHSSGVLTPDDTKPAPVPLWLFKATEAVISGHVYAWQRGEKWRVEWPQEKHPDAIQISFLHSVQGPAILQESRATRYPGLHPSFVSPCVCGCGAPSWLSARLVQETGRCPVLLQVVYHGDRRMEDSSHESRMMSGVHLANQSVAPAGVRIVGSSERMMGFGWNAEGTEFWKRVRGEGNWAAAVRRWWRC